ncbi:hypothetical protein ALP38_200087 [Pseudomonas amygdali pv. sesami]|nr:hypothetical protein ALP38_200087 [Pseudomonas amygdali pv. sesami]
MPKEQLKKVTLGINQLIYLYHRPLVDVQLRFQEFRFVHHPLLVVLIVPPMRL